MDELSPTVQPWSVRRLLLPRIDKVGENALSYEVTPRRREGNPSVHVSLQARWDHRLDHALQLKTTRLENAVLTSTWGGQHSTTYCSVWRNKHTLWNKATRIETKGR